MSKNRKVSHAEIEARVDQILRLGYYVMELEWFHFRFQDAVDFWPSTCRWIDLKGYKYEARGVGIESLIAYLRQNYPLDFDIAA